MTHAAAIAAPRFLPASLTPHALAALRIVTAFLFLQHATAKFFHVPHVAAFDALPVMSFFGFVGIFELLLGALVLIGLFTRISAFLLSGQMAVAYFMAHAAKGNALAPMLNQGEPAVLFSFIFLLLAAAGAGAWSIDARRSTRSTS
jgi:putative oxidoreductase